MARAAADGVRSSRLQIAALPERPRSAKQGVVEQNVGLGLRRGCSSKATGPSAASVGTHG